MTSGHSVSLGNADDPAEYDPASPFESPRGHHRSWYDLPGQERLPRAMPDEAIAGRARPR
jgi:hypothetical protein